MLIVLEGCDGTGKTTLAKFLSKVLKADIVHCTKDTPNDYDFFYQIISAAITENIIADRFCYGQFVYQKESDRKLTKELLYRLEADMMKANAKLIFVTAPKHFIEARLAARCEITDMPVEKIVNRFEDLMKESILPVIRYDTGFNWIDDREELL